MSAAAIVMMVVSMLVVWGGLALAIVLLIRNDGRQDHGPGIGTDREHLTRDL
ncbi:methionine/alanine import family NSS transporter small subunit [Nocardioides gilvus]|uniref:methionine/alanine import family NSS transporter small subunit n=1 Tax=Nocardioides gilvus TaxID=1735589 RepID=UPI000D742018|nr:methionine/alanine import family NSS transporter small subunit [Nocardioides gilvus]